ncbi:MAG: Tfp pilus assembly protein FimT/FimU [Polyangia bacterium]
MRRRGFTLIELMVVVAIIAGVTTAGMVMYGKAVRGDKAPGFARSLVGMINQARQAAITSGGYSRLALTIGTSGAASTLSCQQQDPKLTAVSTNISAVTTWVDLGGTMAAPNDVEFCAVSAATNLTTLTPSCPATTAVNLCFAPSGWVTVSNNDTCPGTVGATNPSGATLYVSTLDGDKHYKVMIFGLTGLPRLTDQW